MNTLRIATRQSPLALWQAEHVAEALRRRFPAIKVELRPMSTRGDQMLESSLARIGGKGLFIKELEQAMARGEADLAVHSMKDVGAQLPDGFGIVAILERENPYDALLSPHYSSLEALPPGARVGTCSLRRQMQLKRLRPDLNTIDLRGNVQSRLAKLDAGEFDAIILAAAGLIRLGLQERITALLSDFVPAVGQGAIGIECHRNSPFLPQLEALHHPQTALEVLAERRIAAALEASCQVPLAAFARLQQEHLHMNVRLGTPDGRRCLALSASAPLAERDSMIDDLIGQLWAGGAAEILASLA